jgi:hypothetical protein
MASKSARGSDGTGFPGSQLEKSKINIPSRKTLTGTPAEILPLYEGPRDQQECGGELGEVARGNVKPSR